MGVMIHLIGFDNEIVESERKKKTARKQLWNVYQ